MTPSRPEDTQDGSEATPVAPKAYKPKVRKAGPGGRKKKPKIESAESSESAKPDPKPTKLKPKKSKRKPKLTAPKPKSKPTEPESATAGADRLNAKLERLTAKARQIRAKAERGKAPKPKSKKKPVESTVRPRFRRPFGESKAKAPKPNKEDPPKFKREPDPVELVVEPEVTKPEPVELVREPEPAEPEAPEPEPVELVREPEPAEPEATETEPVELVREPEPAEPEATETEPVELVREPEPAEPDATETEPVELVREPEPAEPEATEPEPVPTEPDPVATDPEPEPVKLKLVKEPEVVLPAGLPDLNAKPVQPVPTGPPPNPRRLMTDKPAAVVKSPTVVEPEVPVTGTGTGTSSEQPTTAGKKVRPWLLVVGALLVAGTWMFAPGLIEQQFPKQALSAVAALNCTPSAEVFLDGKSLGTTPLAFDLAPEATTLTLKRPGFSEKTVDVVSADEGRLKTPRYLLNLEPAPVGLDWSELPPGTKVIWDKKTVDPKQFTSVNSGAHHPKIVPSEGSTFKLLVTAPPPVFEGPPNQQSSPLRVGLQIKEALARRPLLSFSVTAAAGNQLIKKVPVKIIPKGGKRATIKASLPVGGTQRVVLPAEGTYVAKIESGGGYQAWSKELKLEAGQNQKVAVTLKYPRAAPVAPAAPRYSRPYRPTYRPRPSSGGRRISAPSF